MITSQDRRGGSEHPWHHHAVRLLVPALMLGVMVILSVRGVNYLSYAIRAVSFPFGLDYAEGIVWQQMLLIPGPRMYAGVTQPPFIVFHYPPVYHLLVRAVAALGIDPLAAGRGVSLAAIIITAAFAGGITFSAMQGNASHKARIVGSVLAGLMVTTYRPVREAAVWMRPDALAIALSMAGIYFSILAHDRYIKFIIPVILFFLAVYTKQTELSAPIAALAIIAIIDFRRALTAAAFGLTVSSISFIILMLTTHGGFWQHIITYNLHNRFIPKNVVELLYRQKGDSLGLLAGTGAFVFLWWNEARQMSGGDFGGWIAAIRQSKKLRTLCIVSLWFALASAQLVELGKSGAWDNYFVEWMCITTVPIGMAATIAWDGLTIRSKYTPLFGLVGLLLSLFLAGHALHRSRFEFGIVDNPEAAAVREHLVDLIRASRKPIISDDMVLILRAGKHVFIEPAIFTELADTGYWDQRPLLKLIQNQAFALIITQADTMEDEVAGGIFTQEVAHAIETSYPYVEHLENYVIRRPSGP